MKIISLKTENVKKVSAVEISPTGDMVVIGGNNGEGKSSILDSIMMALAGKKSICERPLKEGAKKGSTVLDLGKYIVTRTYTAAGGGTITVKNADGATYSSPQSILDGLTGDLTFDPVKFANLPGTDQLKTLQKLVGLDFTELDAEYKKVYGERTEFGRQGVTAKAKLDGLTDHGGIVAVDIADTLSEIERIDKANLENEKERGYVRQMSDGLDSEAAGMEEVDQDRIQEQSTLEGLIAATEATLKKLKGDLEALASKFEGERMYDAQHYVESTTAYTERAALLPALVDENTDALRLKLSTAEETNQKVRDNAARIESKKETDDLKAKWTDKADRLKEISAEKTRQLSEANFPVEKLSFDETGVLYQGVPFSQASAAERLRVSVAMGIAMCPELKIMLIRDASLLDEKNMNILAEMAAASGCQMWIERVGKGSECSVIIEDGVLI